jgi:hypothetical protein
MLMNVRMNLLDLTVTQLKRAAAIKEQIEALTKELRAMLGAPATTRAAPKKNRTMSAAAKKQLAAARKARWAKLRRANPAAQWVKPVAKAKKKTVSPATKAKLSAKLKAYWAAKKKSGKK